MRPKAATAAAAQGPAPGATVPVSRPAAAVRAAIVLCVAVVAAGLVAGAAAIKTPDADTNTLRGFQVRVLSISQAVAEDRTDGALAAVQALEKDLNDAAATGRLSAARYRGIETALAAVKADLATRVAAAAPPAAPVAEAGAPAPAATSPEPRTQEAAVPAAAQDPAPAPADSPVSGPSGSSPELPDKARDAKGKDKGQGRP